MNIKLKSYWNCLDIDSKKFALRQYAPNISDNNIDALAELCYEEIENYGYSSLIEGAVKKDMKAQSDLC